jgi:hypothetical protein
MPKITNTSPVEVSVMVGRPIVERGEPILSRRVPYSKGHPDRA